MTVDVKALAEDGFAIVPGLIPGHMLDTFERDIATFVAAETDRTPMEPSDDRDRFIDVLTRDQAWRETVFPLLRNLMSVQRMGTYVAEWLSDTGLLDELGFEVPLVWPTLRADPPNEATYLLPLHQDYASTVCHRAYRLWIPLRDADEVDGTMALHRGSHRLGPLSHDVSDPGSPSVPASALAETPREVVTAKAGDAVLFDTMLVHGSVPPVGRRTKFVLLVQAQDLATVMDPSDPSDEHGAVLRRVREARQASSE